MHNRGGVLVGGEGVEVRGGAGAWRAGGVLGDLVEAFVTIPRSHMNMYQPRCLPKGKREVAVPSAACVLLDLLDVAEDRV